jgi:ArsR family transcriptional regulator, arsenate/arsenite/antimonite-responsive transcriptional repressor
MPSTATTLNVRPITRLFRALGDETRLRIVALLTHGELCVCHIETALSLSQPSASRQLGILRAADVVETRREGIWIYYRLAAQADRDCKAILRTLSKSFAAEERLRRDVERLVKVKGPGTCR